MKLRGGSNESIVWYATLGIFLFLLYASSFFLEGIHMLFLLGPILSHLSFPSYGLQLGMFIFASVIIFKTSVLVSWVYSVGHYPNTALKTQKNKKKFFLSRGVA